MADTVERPDPNALVAGLSRFVDGVEGLFSAKDRVKHAAAFLLARERLADLLSLLAAREPVAPAHHNAKNPACGYGWTGPDDEPLPCDCELVASVTCTVKRGADGGPLVFLPRSRFEVGRRVEVHAIEEPDHG